jgi:MFS transporter, ACS family, solute carrier family 17 (sodium-dependent inorganic phosphate cotransporter), other
MTHINITVEMIAPNSTAIQSNETIATTTVVPVATEAPLHHSVRFDWNEKEKQLILGSFFWGYVLTELPGGRLGKLSNRLIINSIKCNLFIYYAR